MACGDSSGAKYSGTWTASAAGVMALSESFIELLVAGDQKASLPVFLCSSTCSGPWRAPLPGVLICCSAHKTHRHPPAGVLLCRSMCWALKGVPWLGSYSVVQPIRHIEGAPWLGSHSVVQFVRHLVGQTLYCSAANDGMLGERGYGDGSSPYV